MPQQEQDPATSGKRSRGYNSPPGGCGGTGRRARFRSVWGRPRGGSSPLIRIQEPLWARYGRRLSGPCCSSSMRPTGGIEARSRTGSTDSCGRCSGGWAYRGDRATRQNGRVTSLNAATRRKAAGRICTYCGEDSLTGRQRPEHPIQKVLDSEITVFTACDPCNARAGKEVDKPWLQHLFVQAERVKWQLADPRHKRPVPPHPILDGIFRDEDGHVVVAQGGVPRYAGSIVQDGDRRTIAADTPERPAELRARLERQLADEGRAVEDYSEEQRSFRPRLTAQASVSLSSGVRMGAKLGLAF